MTSTKNSINLSDRLWVFFMGNSNFSVKHDKMFTHDDILSHKWLHFSRNGP